MSLLTRLANLEKKVNQKRLESFYGQHLIRSSTNSVIPYVNTVYKNTVQETGIVTNTTAAGWNFRAYRRCIFIGTASIQGSTTELQIGWSLNSNQLTTGVESISANNRLTFFAHTDVTNQFLHSITQVTVLLTPGDTIRLHVTTAMGSQATPTLVATFLPVDRD